MLFDEVDAEELFNGLPRIDDLWRITLNGFNLIALNILNNGHLILFLMFFYMGIKLFRRSKKNLYNAQAQGINEAYLKKKGRNISCIFVLIGFGFLSGIFTNIYLLLFSPNFNSFFLSVINKENLNDFSAFNKLDKLTLEDKTCLLLVCIGSFIGFILFMIGTYILLYGKTLLKSKLKASGFLCFGIILFIIFGITSFLGVLNSIF